MRLAQLLTIIEAPSLTTKVEEVSERLKFPREREEAGVMKQRREEDYEKRT